MAGGEEADMTRVRWVKQTVLVRSPLFPPTDTEDVEAVSDLVQPGVAMIRTSMGTTMHCA